MRAPHYLEFKSNSCQLACHWCDVSLVVTLQHSNTPTLQHFTTYMLSGWAERREELQARARLRTDCPDCPPVAAGQNMALLVSPAHPVLPSSR